MQFNVSVQGKPYKTIEALNTGVALSMVAEDITAGLVPDLDPNADQNIVIAPASPTMAVKAKK
jgi:hypothetical protein